ncbi:MAG TPA: LytR C-terminal domain-containing protein [Acidimicrobiia bacterium]|nr:LytR C-terminal domain-containing protein [Acidimicrobiia bacterium]
MSDRGRHVRRSGLGFYRDVASLVAGIVLVGALVFGGLSWWAGRDGDSTTTTAGGSTLTTTTSTTVLTTAVPTTPPTTPPTIATSTSPSTTDAPATTSAPPTTLRTARQPSEVRVIVLNSIGVTGLAGELSDQLGGMGYQMIEAANYTPELSDTMIFHADGYSLEALDLSEAVPDGTVAPDQELAEEWDVDIVVVIGRSYQE